MRKFFVFAIVISAFCAPIAQAQFGSVIVVDPTQSVHAVQQIMQASQLYTTTIQTTQNVIAAYNLAERMATAPQSLYSSYTNMGRQAWTSVTAPANTYGNTQVWTTALTTGNSAFTGSQQVSVSPAPRISDSTIGDDCRDEGGENHKDELNDDVDDEKIRRCEDRHRRAGLRDGSMNAAQHLLRGVSSDGIGKVVGAALDESLQGVADPGMLLS